MPSVLQEKQQWDYDGHLLRPFGNSFADVHHPFADIEEGCHAETFRGCRWTFPFLGKVRMWGG